MFSVPRCGRGAFPIRRTPLSTLARSRPVLVQSEDNENLDSTRRRGPLHRTRLLWHIESVTRTTPRQRSEEHTSELQSLRHLVCRLLLEKKKVKDGNGAVSLKGKYELGWK